MRWLCSVLCLWPLIALHAEESKPKTEGEASADKEERLALQASLARFRAAQDLLQLIKQSYANETQTDRLWQGAYRGMVESLDRHSEYFSKQELALRGSSNDGQAIGFGFDWQYIASEGLVKVVRVIDGSAAAIAGMAAEDVILSIGETSLNRLSKTEVIKVFSQTSDDASFKVRHADDSIATLKMSRQEYQDSGVSEHRMLEGNIGFVRITRFLAGKKPSEAEAQALATTLTGKTFRNAMRGLRNKGLKALIIDLRGNGGGDVHAAIEIADCFLSGNELSPTLIAQQASRQPSQHRSWYAKAETTLPHWPIAILIDETTASSAEIIAAALKDHRRAIIVGTPSSGKDSIQQLFRLSNGDGVRLTVARFLTPKGATIYRQGVMPDVTVRVDAKARYALAKQRRMRQDKSNKASPETTTIDRVAKRAHELLTAHLLLRHDSPSR